MRRSIMFGLASVAVIASSLMAAIGYASPNGVIYQQPYGDIVSGCGDLLVFEGTYTVQAGDKAIQLDTTAFRLGSLHLTVGSATDTRTVYTLFQGQKPYQISIPVTDPVGTPLLVRYVARGNCIIGNELHIRYSVIRAIGADSDQSR